MTPQTPPWEVLWQKIFKTNKPIMYVKFTQFYTFMKNILGQNIVFDS